MNKENREKRGMTRESRGGSDRRRSGDLSIFNFQYSGVYADFGYPRKLNKINDFASLSFA